MIHRRRRRAGQELLEVGLLLGLGIALFLALMALTTPRHRDIYVTTQCGMTTVAS